MELAAELHDTVVEDIAKVYPRRLLQYVSIEIVDLQDFILSTYDRRIAEYATEHFKRQNIKLWLGYQVKKVEFGKLTLENKNTKELLTIPFGLCVWCTGIKLNPLAEGLVKTLGPGVQDNLRSLTVDRHLRVKGTEGSVFSLGDCATIDLGDQRAKPHAERLFESAGKPALSVDDLQAVLRTAKADFPHLEEASQRVKERYEKFYKPGTEGLSREEFAALLEEADRGLRALPATAQVAKQEGEFLAAHFNRAAGSRELLAGNELQPFDYRHKGSLAYVGNVRVPARARAVGVVFPCAGAAPAARRSRLRRPPTPPVRRRTPRSRTSPASPSSRASPRASSGRRARRGRAASAAGHTLGGPARLYLLRSIPALTLLLLTPRDPVAPQQGFETYSQVSVRNLLLVTGDWIRSKLFGRDLSRLF